MSVLDELPTDLDRANALVYHLICRATGKPTDAKAYGPLRGAFVSHPTLSSHLPKWFPSLRTEDMFWQYIKKEISGYEPRRQFIWAEFEPLVSACEGGASAPSSEVEESLKKLSSDAVDRMWSKTLSRISQDPDGAITAARSLVESVCKHILDDLGEVYDTKGDLPILYKLVSNRMHLSADQQQEQVFKQILGGCSSVVSGFASFRNSHADAHGQGRKPIVAKKRHAILAVNLAGTMATFLVETFQERKNANTSRADWTFPQ